MACLITVGVLACGGGVAIVKGLKKKDTQDNKRIEQIANFTIHFLGSWLSIAMLNYGSSNMCIMGTKLSKKCPHIFTDITCPIFYAQALACPVNRAINSVGSFGFTLGIFMIKAAAQILSEKRKQNS